jgi:hypothetical protein
LAFIVLAAALPSLLCLGSSAFLAYKERPQWVWFAALSLVTGWGGRAAADHSADRLVLAPLIEKAPHRAFSFRGTPCSPLCPANHNLDTTLIGL